MNLPPPAATALIADDEEAPREQLRHALARCWPELRIVAETADGAEAWDAWLVHEPRLVFLDVRMPVLTGLDVAQRIGARAHIVFVAAPGDHALDAFAAATVDVLLKPVDEQPLRAIVERLQPRLHEPPPELQALLARLVARQRAPAPLEVLQAGVGREAEAIPVDEVIFFGADARYTRVVHRGGETLVRVPLKELLPRLDPQRFLQVNRFVIVNERWIAGALRSDDGQMTLTLRERAERLPVARPLQDQFRAR